MSTPNVTPVADEHAEPPAKRERRRRWRRPRVRWTSVLLSALGIAMLMLGVVQDTTAVAVALVLLGPLIVVVGALLELFETRMVRLVLSRFGIEAELAPPPSAEELEQAGLPEGVAEALEQWLADVTKLLPVEIDRRVREALDARERLDKSLEQLARTRVERRMREERGEP